MKGTNPDLLRLGASASEIGAQNCAKLLYRCLGWLTHRRRLARDYEQGPAYSEAWVHLAETQRLLKHLAPDPSLPVPDHRREAPKLKPQ